VAAKAAPATSRIAPVPIAAASVEDSVASLPEAGAALASSLTIASSLPALDDLRRRDLLGGLIHEYEAA
jgi:hypothetical protein